MSSKRRNTIQLSHESFIDTYGEDKVPKDHFQNINRRITKLAGKVLRKISFRHTALKTTLKTRRNTVSTPTHSSFENERQKLLKELSMQRMKLLKEQQILCEMIKESKKVSIKEAKFGSCLSIISSDPGYESAVDEENEDSFKTSSMYSSSPDVSAEIMAEIEDFENFIKLKA